MRSQLQNLHLASPRTSFVRALMTVTLAFSVIAPSSAFAEDELLDLLGGGNTSNQKASAQESSELRKLISSSNSGQKTGQTTAEQNIFIDAFEKGDMKSALYQWPSAFESSAFAKTASGRALNTLVLFRNGLKITALESLLAIESPEAISPVLVKMWQDAAPVTDNSWSLVQVANWNPFWTTSFGAATEIRVRSRQVYGSDKVDQLKELIKKTQVDTAERAWLSWQLVLALSTGDDAGTAAKALAVLMKAPNNPVSQDLLTITAARLLFQNGFLDASVKYYEKIPKNSDYWFDAQEEIGWAYIRKGESQNTIAITKTLTVPEFVSQVGPEPLFLRSLAELKVCDYPSVVGTLNQFRDRYKGRAATLMALSDTTDSAAESKVVDSFIERSKKERLTLKKLGKDATKLPRFVTRDEVLAQAVATQSALEAEAKLAGDLYAKSASAGTAQIGFQARLEEMKKAVEARALQARSTSASRVKSLAQEEVNEIAQILQKLHIVEAEMLQQLSLSSRVADATAGDKESMKVGTTGSKAKDRLTFPAEQETWFDELANYKVDIKKGCQAAKR